MTHDPCANAENIISLKSKRDVKNPVNFTVCIPPLHNHYDDVDELTNMIEVNTYFGADRFVVYVKSCGPNVAKYLDFYSQLANNFLKVVPWNLSVPGVINTTSDIYYQGQHAAILDGFYRNLATTKYITFLDLDEALVSHNDILPTWPYLVEDFQTKKTDFPACAILFRHMGFRRVTNHTRDTINSTWLRRTTRDAKPGLTSRRAKYIGDARYLEIPGIHVVRSCLRGFKFTYNPTIALLHHYRRVPLTTKNGVEDTTVSKHAKVLQRRINEVHRKVNMG